MAVSTVLGNLAAPVGVKKPELVRTRMLDSVGMDAELVQKASKLLGYCPAELARVEIKAAFDKMGIDPLNNESVQKYKEEMAERMSVELYKQYGRGWASWNAHELSSYKAEVPMFALSHACELKELLPEAQFFVEVLSFNPDPFLVMVYKDVRVYVDVWDEPKFEGRRTV